MDGRVGGEKGKARAHGQGADPLQSPDQSSPVETASIEINRISSQLESLGLVSQKQKPSFPHHKFVGEVIQRLE